MKLDRNINGDGRGKYALLKLRKLDAAKDVHSPQGLMEIEHAIRVLEVAGIIDYGTTPQTAFFPIRLRDKYAAGALHTYASYAAADGEIEYARDVMELVQRAGSSNPYCKKPD